MARHTWLLKNDGGNFTLAIVSVAEQPASTFLSRVILAPTRERIPGHRQVEPPVFDVETGF